MAKWQPGDDDEGDGDESGADEEKGPVAQGGYDQSEGCFGRHDLADAFTGLLTPQDAGGWRPHVTIQNKVQPNIAKLLMASLSRDFKPWDAEIAGLAAWWYRGGPWEALSRHMFA